ncbi:Atrial natriuretic peptide receptor 1 [Hypsibius exemplaris]|uniref:guanylate cyclase n=1 Tax=Hypsibius exemplaris TaxID=2072580 RepID=A0A1W0X851_HYPEX|nr:Atrial natriuretic peptide receptor 1 [Hypsibius exemplaris]
MKGVWVMVLAGWVSLTLTNSSSWSGSPVHVQLITSLPYDFNVATAIIYTGAAFELAVEAANNRYAPFLNVSLTMLYNSSHQRCEDISAAAVVTLSDYYYRHRNKANSVYGLVSSPCSEAIGTQSVATEWDWLLFANGLAQDDFLDNNITPTAMAIGGTFRGYAVILLRILAFYRWSHVTLLLQTRTQTTFYNLMASTLLDRAKGENIYNFLFSMDCYSFDNAVPQSMADALDYASKRSRVLVILSPGKTAVDLLLMAEDQGMGNGEFVFINIQPLQQEVYGKASQFDHPLPRYMKIFRSVLVVTYRSAGSELDELNQKIADRTKLRYNRTYDNGSQPLDSYAIQASYDIVDLFALAVNESLATHQPDAEWSGRALAALLTDRNFTDLTTGFMYISKESARFLDLVVFGFSTKTQTMRQMGKWSVALRELSWTNLIIDWPTKDGQPPPDLPNCGFSGLEGDCVHAATVTLLNILLPVILTFGLALLFFVFIRKRRYKSKKKRNWLIAQQDLATRRNSSDGNSWTSGNANWKGKRVWTKSVTMKQLPTEQCFVFLDLLLKPSFKMLHPNINTFFGLCLPENRAILVSNYCKHGSLYDLYYEMSLDWDFKYSLLSDLIEGMYFIHTTLNMVHGRLHAKVCLVDDRFTLRIGELNYHHIVSYLTKQPPRTINYLWTAPEIIDAQTRLSREGDIFAVGLIVTSISSQEEPRRVQHPVGCLVDIPAYVPAEIRLLIERCASDDVQSRPSIQLVKRRFGQMEPLNGTKGNIVDRVFARYSTYTATLENAVRERSEELKRERMKCDEILQQMLPAFVLDKLRTSRIIPAEYFEESTIYFSDLVGFVSWVTLVSPWTVMKMLNLMMAVFDSQIAHYAVQKIESVGDSYMVASGIPTRNDQHAAEICRMALSLIKTFKDDGSFPSGFLLRVGIHSGSCAAGVIGTKVPRYCLFGDAVNIASRMQSHGQGSRVHVSSTTAELILPHREEFICVERGVIPIKGKGKMLTYWLTAP